MTAPKPKPPPGRDNRLEVAAARVRVRHAALTIKCRVHHTQRNEWCGVLPTGSPWVCDGRIRAAVNIARRAERFKREAVETAETAAGDQSDHEETKP